MPALATERARRAPSRRDRAARAPRAAATAGTATLDARVSGAWRALVADGIADCLVCGTRMAAGRACPGCGSELG